MGALWDEHDERAFVRHAGVRSRLAVGDKALWARASTQTVSLCDAARRGCLSLRTALLVWASGVSISRGGIQRRLPAKSPGRRAHTRLTDTQRQRAPGLYPLP